MKYHVMKARGEVVVYQSLQMCGEVLRVPQLNTR